MILSQPVLNILQRTAISRPSSASPSISYRAPLGSFVNLEVIAPVRIACSISREIKSSSDISSFAWLEISYLCSLILSRSLSIVLFNESSHRIGVRYTLRSYGLTLWTSARQGVLSLKPFLERLVLSRALLLGPVLIRFVRSWVRRSNAEFSGAL
jgi:hypothetical protein